MGQLRITISNLKRKCMHFFYSVSLADLLENQIKIKLYPDIQEGSHEAMMKDLSFLREFFSLFQRQVLCFFNS